MDLKSGTRILAYLRSLAFWMCSIGIRVQVKLSTRYTEGKSCIINTFRAIWKEGMKSDSYLTVDSPKSSEQYSITHLQKQWKH